MKYERLHGPLFICRGCGTRGRWLWWWNRRNGAKMHCRKMCPRCGRRCGWKFMGMDINRINHGSKNTMKIFSLCRRG